MTPSFQRYQLLPIPSWRY